MHSPSCRFAPALLIAALAAITVDSTAADIAPAGSAKPGLKPPERVATVTNRAASDEWQKAMKRFRVPPNFTVELFAAEPMLGNPVALCVDNDGRVFVSETHRYRTSVLDIRHYMFMLENDLANRTVEDRMAEIRKNFPNEWQKLGIETEVIRLLEDRDHDGKADYSAVYADGFTTPMDGIASGVLAHDGKVWFTNIPNLWLLEGMDKDGHATKREVLSTGYGVRFSFTGHDMHGLILGPDGRLYFSFGDRGAFVTTREGKTLAFSDEGAVFRCEPDGSHMEAFCRGLRNPQELAFDKFGNLFTGDNDSDQGDRERWEYLVDGADYGWRVGWQHNPLGKEHNPWLAEKLWVPYFPGQAAYILPPIANIPDGPSGLAYYPGTGLPGKYEGHFFLCNFKGSAARSVVSSWAVTPIFAGFRMQDEQTFIGGCQATDICFGPDSKMYFTEWGEGWEGTGRGRVFTIYDGQAIGDPQVEEVRRLLGGELKGKAPVELQALLRHGDQRIRLEAEWLLAEKPEGERAFLDAATSGPTDHPEPLMARLHGIWGLGILARRAEYKSPGAAARILAPLTRLLEDEDEEVRSQAAKVLGENHVDAAYDGLIRVLRGEGERASFFAAQALAKLGRKECVPQVLLMLGGVGERDQFRRHAYVQALVGANDFPALQAAAKSGDAGVRMCVLLAMRRMERAEIAQFLGDEDPLVVMEAVRAINDVPIASALAQLAALIVKPVADEQFMVRVLNANFRTGTAAAAQALADFAATHEGSAWLRGEALKLLGMWATPPDRDQVTGVYRPLGARSGKPATDALHAVLPKLLGAKSDATILAAIDAMSVLEMKDDASALHGLMAKKELSAKVRGRALEALAGFADAKLADAIQMALTDKDPALRVSASAMLAKLDPDAAAAQLAGAFAAGGIAEKKTILNALGGIRGASADKALAAMLDDMRAGKIAPEVQLELLEAAAKRTAPGVKAKLQAYNEGLPKGDLLAAFKPALLGGDKAAGETLFREHAVAACLRCHKVRGSGGEAGPDLTDIGAKKDRAYILESIILPNAKIAEGFQTMIITMKNGDIQAGVVQSEDANEVALQPPGAALVHLKKADIKSREAAPSGMPPNFADLLTKREIRDIVEFVASLKE
jgi:quinoprotein glucose dehydrogenase